MSVAAFPLDYALAEPDKAVIAKHVAQSKREAGKRTPSEARLTQAIQQIQINTTIQGASSIVVTVVDPDWELFDSGFFDVNDDGRIDRIDVNYPDGSSRWWRLTQISPQNGTRTIDLTFLDREAVELMFLNGPFKSNRASMTRAQFLKRCYDKINPTGEFICSQLNVVEPIQNGLQAKANEQTKATKKGQAISGGLTIQWWDGSQVALTRQQISYAIQILDVCQSHKAGDRASLACLEAAIVEGELKNPDNGTSTSTGMFQLLASTAQSTGLNPLDVSACAAAFLTTGFAGKGGAIALVKEHPTWSAGQVAQAIEGSAYPDRYDKAQAGAQKLLQEYGGVSGFGGTVQFTEPYYFTIGTTQTPHEQFWTGMQRLAQQVAWELFIDDGNCYYDADTRLIRQAPVAVIDRSDAGVVDWSYEWDLRQICTQMQLTLICEPFEFRAGQVFKLRGFGPASTGSTVTKQFGGPLPGRWLIQQSQRNRSDLTTVFTLVQPSLPKMEPAPQISTSPDVGSALTGTVRSKIVQAATMACQLQQTNPNAYYYTEQYDRTAAAKYGLFPAPHSNGSPVELDCSGFATACYQAGGAPDPNALGYHFYGNTTSLMAHGKRISYQQAKPGDLIFYYNGGHVAVYLGKGKIANMGAIGEPKIEDADVNGFVPFQVRSYTN